MWYRGVADQVKSIRRGDRIFLPFLYEFPNKRAIILGCAYALRPATGPAYTRKRSGGVKAPMPSHLEDPTGVGQIPRIVRLSVNFIIALKVRHIERHIGFAQKRGARAFEPGHHRRALVRNVRLRRRVAPIGGQTRHAGRVFHRQWQALLSDMAPPPECKMAGKPRSHTSETVFPGSAFAVILFEVCLFCCGSTSYALPHKR